MQVSDLLRGNYPRIANELYKGDYSLIVHLGCLYSKYAPLDSWEKVYRMIEEGNTHPYSKPKGETVQIGLNLLKRTVEKLALVDKIFQDASLRQGVQVIYGGDGFLQYYQEAQKDERLDSAVWNASRLPERIPLKFTTAILPLGAYEKEKML